MRLDAHVQHAKNVNKVFPAPDNALRLRLRPRVRGAGRHVVRVASPSSSSDAIFHWKLNLFAVKYMVIRVRLCVRVSVCASFDGL